MGKECFQEGLEVLTRPSVLFQISVSDLEVSRKSLMEKIMGSKKIAAGRNAD